MKLANNRLRTRYWIEADNGKVLVDSFKLFSKKKIGPFISVVTDDNDEYLITSDTVFKGYSHVECINQLCYVVTNIIGNIARSSTYDMEGNIISHDMQVFVQKNDGLLTAKSKGKYGFVDTNLNWVIEPMFLAIITRFRNGVAVVKTDDKTIDTCVAINKKGEIIGKEIKYEKIQKAFGDYLFAVDINNLKGVYDYVGNEVETEPLEIKIDLETPTAPTIDLEGEVGEDGWYKSNVKVRIIPGTDNISGVEKTTYKILGDNATDEAEGLEYTLEKNGTSTIIATTYDKAGNATSTTEEIKIDASEPPAAKITIINGEKNHVDNDWYKTPVRLKIDVEDEGYISGRGISSYKITGDSAVQLTRFEGNTIELPQINTNGEHIVTVITSTKAGKINTIEYPVKIDMDAPNSPDVSIVGVSGSSGWYTKDDVKVTVNSVEDIGKSDVLRMTYTITKNGETSVENEIRVGGTIPFNEEGEHTLYIYSIDNALNRRQSAPIPINIDTTDPTPAEFDIDGKMGDNSWYKEENVVINHTPASDNVSGIQSVILSHRDITQNTLGTEITLITKDIAGNSVTKTKTIKLDKNAPTEPIINIDKDPVGIDELFGIQTYNEGVTIMVTPGDDTKSNIESGIYRNTLEITTDNGETVLLKEIEGSTYDITEDGDYTIIARAYDKAGNVTEVTKNISIRTSKPLTPKIRSINGTVIGDASTKEVTGGKEIQLQVDNLTVGNDVEIILINQTTNEKIIINTQAPSNKILNIELDKKGTYSVKLTQTNMYEVESNESEGFYLYTYQ